MFLMVVLEYCCWLLVEKYVVYTTVCNSFVILFCLSVFLVELVTF